MQSRLSRSFSLQSKLSAHKSDRDRTILGLPIRFYRVDAHDKNSILIYRLHSQNVFTNLAFEEYLYNSENLHDKKIVILWRSSSSVVVGRFQNPWSECNIRGAAATHVHIARRKSGGGTVYHDLGNINCTVLTRRDAYDRKDNLRIVAEAVRKYGGPQLKVNERDDLLTQDGSKVSGTAARLGLKSAYHHFTLLCSTDVRNLSSLLQPSIDTVHSNATPSLKVPVTNVFGNERWDFKSITDVIAHEFWCQHVSRHHRFLNSVKELNLSKDEMSGQLLKLRKELCSWEWIFGKTPKFSILATDFIADEKVKLALTVEKGVIAKASFTLGEKEQDESKVVCRALVGIRFSKKEAITAASLALIEAQKAGTIISHFILNQIP